MIKQISILFLACAVVSCGSVSFQTLALYDSFEQPSEEEKIEEVVYKDGAGTMWNSLFECGEFEITNKVFYEGNSSIKISWDKGKGCEWIGFGNSFSNWGAADMSKARHHKALSFFVRTQTKTASAIPIVASLEDFGGGGTYLFIDAKKYLYGLSMDTTWKQIIVPMWDFPTEEGNSGNDGIDISSIKQMKFQLEGAGSFYIDEIKLIEYSKEDYNKMRQDVEEMRPKGNPNQTIYRENQFAFDAWNVGVKSCSSLVEEEDGGNKFIHWKIASENCEYAKWGINWNDWYQVNFRGIITESRLQFKIKATNDVRFKIMIEDFQGHSSDLFSNFANVSEQGDWTLIEIPLSSFELEKKNFALDQIKQLVFQGLSPGEVYLDDIKIVSIF